MTISVWELGSTQRCGSLMVAEIHCRRWEGVGTVLLRMHVIYIQSKRLWARDAACSVRFPTLQTEGIARDRDCCNGWRELSRWWLTWLAWPEAWNRTVRRVPLSTLCAGRLPPPLDSFRLTEPRGERDTSPMHCVQGPHSRSSSNGVVALFVVASRVFQDKVEVGAVP